MKIQAPFWIPLSDLVNHILMQVHYGIISEGLQVGNEEAGIEGPRVRKRKFRAKDVISKNPEMTPVS